MFKNVALETKIILLIGLLDLLFSLLFIHNQRGSTIIEGNPLMRIFFTRPILLVLVKLVFLVCPLGFIEWAKQHHPVSTKWMSRLCIATYIGVICEGILGNLAGF